MRKLTVCSIAVLLFVLGYSSIKALERISPSDAVKFIGRKATVCGHAAGSLYDPKRKGRPTFFYLDRNYPNHIFTIVIWGNYRSKFKPTPESKFMDHNVCVTGNITSDNKIPQIVISDPRQIKTEH